VAEDRESQFQRLLLLVARLLGSQGLSVRDLGGHDGAARRRIQRDLNRLRECGLPLQSTEHHERVPRYWIDNLRLPGGLLGRVERIPECHSTGQRFDIPAAPSPHFPKGDLVEGEPVLVVCQVDENTARWLCENPVHPTQRLERDLFSLEVRDPDSFIQWALGLGHCQILRPLALRQQMRQRLLDMLARMG